MKQNPLDLSWQGMVGQSMSLFSRVSAYAVTIRPYTLTVSGVFLTVAVARMISFWNPGLHLETQGGLHVHHYTFGIFAMAIAGYAALVLKGPRASFWITLLYGFGLGLVFDEFGIWLHLELRESLRWSDTGLIILAVVFLVGIALASVLQRKPKPRRTAEQALPDAEVVAD
jgi:hypothetical protein